MTSLFINHKSLLFITKNIELCFSDFPLYTYKIDSINIVGHQNKTLKFASLL